MDINRIHQQIKNEKYLWSYHADEERRNDGLEIKDVEKAILNGKILENYPDDPRGASCLICGEVRPGLAVHVVCGKNKMGFLRIITVYKPTLPKWETPVRRSKQL